MISTTVRIDLAQRIAQAALRRGEFTLRSGKKSSYYLDKYLFETDPTLLKSIASELARLLPSPDRYDRFAGPELGAVALVTALAMEVGKPFVIVRKVAKGYGTGKRVEGRFGEGDRFVVVEDVLTTGGAALDSVKGLESEGGRVVHILGVIDREEGAREKIEAASYSLTTLFTKTDLGIT